MRRNLLLTSKSSVLFLKHENIRERMTYSDELQFLGEHERRNEFIAGLLMHLRGNTLCLYQLVEKHGKPLYEQVQKAQNEGFFDDRMRKLFFIYGNTSTTEREEIRSIVEKEKIQLPLHRMVLLVLVSTFAISTTSCSRARLSLELECSKVSVEDCVRGRIKIPF